MSYALGLNLFYNFYHDFKKEWNYLWVLVPSFVVACVQFGALFYSLAIRNMHALEETIAGNTYNKSDALGITGDEVCKTEECCKKPDDSKKEEEQNVFSLRAKDLVLNNMTKV